MSAARPEVPRRAFSTPVQEAVVETDGSALTPEGAAKQLRTHHRLLSKSVSVSNRYPSHASLGTLSGDDFTKPVQWKDVYGATVRGVRSAPSLYLKAEIELLSQWGSGKAPLPAFVTEGKLNPLRVALTLHRMLHTTNVPVENLRNVLSLLTKLPRPAASASVFDASSPINEPWVAETIRAASEATGAFRDLALQTRMEFVRQLDAEMASVLAFAQECSRDWGFASIRVLHRIYRDFDLPHAADLEPLFRQLIRIGFQKEVPTTLYHYLERASVPREAFNVALEAAALAREPETLRALRALYAATYDLPRDESLPGLPYETATALIEADQAAAIRNYEVFDIAPDTEAIQAYNRAVHEGTFPHWYKGSTPDAAFNPGKDQAVTVTLADHSSPYTVATGVAYSLTRVAKAYDALERPIPANADLVFKLPTAAAVAAKFAERRAAGNGYIVLDSDAALRKDVAALVTTASGELKTLLGDVELITKANTIFNAIALQVSKVLAYPGSAPATQTEGDIKKLVDLEAEFTEISKKIASSVSTGASKQWDYNSLVAAARARAEESGASINVLDEMAKLKPTARAPVSVVSVLTASVPVDFQSIKDIRAQGRMNVDKFLREVQSMPPPTAAAPTTEFNTSLDRHLSVAETLASLAPVGPLTEAIPRTAEALSLALQARSRSWTLTRWMPRSVCSRTST